MFKLILRRLLQAIPVLFCIATLTFFMVRLAPGDPLAQERAVSPEIRQKQLEYYGLDQPLMIQYVRFLGNIARGDLGISITHSNQTVVDIIRNHFPITLQYASLSLIFALCVGIPVGMLAAVRRNTFWDYGPMAIAMVGICLPTFVIGPIFSLVIGTQLRWLPSSGWGDFSHLILPALTLGLFYAAYVARLTRGGMLEVAQMDFIRTARAKGVPQRKIVFKHMFRGGILPVVSFLGPAIAGLLTGSFVVESIFSIPGLGRFFVDSAVNRDYPLILGLVVFYGALIITLNALVDIVLIFLNPRLRNG